jgi:hypothetical protein
MDTQLKNFNSLSYLKKTVISKNPAINRRLPSRLLKIQNTFSKQNTTVIINPLIFKQHQNSLQNQINFTKQNQLAFDTMSNKNDKNFSFSEPEIINFEFNQTNDIQNSNQKVLDTMILNSIIDRF